MRLLYLFIIVSSLYACQNETNKSDINGHWHLYHSSVKDTLMYLKLNVENDTVATLEDFNVIKYGEPIMSLEKTRNVNKKEKAMTLWMLSYVRFNYDILNDTLYLKNTQGDWGFYGLKKAPKLCNFWEHQYSDKFVKIELDEIGTSDEIVVKKAAMPFDIYAGIDKTKGNSAIEVDGRIIDINELPLAFEQFKARLRPSDRDSFYVVVDKHKNLPVEFVRKLNTKLNSIFEMKIYNRKVTKDNELVLTFNSL